MRSIWVCFAGLFSGFGVILIGIEMTGNGSFPVERMFPSETNACWINGDADSRSLQDCPGRAFEGKAIDISLYATA